MVSLLKSCLQGRHEGGSPMSRWTTYFHRGLLKRRQIVRSTSIDAATFFVFFATAAWTGIIAPGHDPAYGGYPLFCF